MKNEIEAMITDITATTAEAEDYTGEDGLLYCGKCHTPKEAYFPKETAQWLGHDRHPAECDCHRAAREKREAAESRQKHLETVEDLKRRGFTDPAMRNWTFEHDNGRNPQTETARFYVESWETMQAENIGYLFWGGVGTGKSYLAACIANALMEKEVAVCMTNFATILNDLAASFEGRNEYISRLCNYPLLILDDLGMERGTEYGLEQVCHHGVLHGGHGLDLVLFCQVPDRAACGFRLCADDRRPRAERVLSACGPYSKAYDDAMEW